MLRSAITVRPQTNSMEELPEGPGAYVLMLDLERSVPLRIVTLPRIHLPPGRYAYVGSAKGRGGMRARLQRHLQTPKKVHWHIDHLTKAASIVEILAFPHADECDVVKRLVRQRRNTTPVAGFGSSDCKQCEAHLLALA